MTHRLSPVLSTADLPPAELLALLHDGQLFRVGGAYLPIDEIEQPRHRALSLLAGMSDRLIAEQRSAAWIWGASDTAPARHQLCVATGARVGHAHPPWMTVREVVIDPAEVVLVGGVQVTTRLRTVVDIVRFSATFASDERRLLQGMGVPLADALADLDARRNLPGKKRATDRLVSALA